MKGKLTDRKNAPVIKGKSVSRIRKNPWNRNGRKSANLIRFILSSATAQETRDNESFPAVYLQRTRENNRYFNNQPQLTVGAHICKIVFMSRLSS